MTFDVVGFRATTMWETIALAWPVTLWASRRRASGDSLWATSIWRQLLGDDNLGDGRFVDVACDVGYWDDHPGDSAATAVWEAVTSLAWPVVL